MAEYVKTTWVSGTVPGIDADKLNNLETQYDKIKSEALTFAALKTFGVIPVLPASNPTEDNQATRKAWVCSRFPTGLIVSDQLQHSNDAQKVSYLTSYEKRKEMKLNAALAVVRIKFTLTCAGGGTAYGQIYKNGGAIGTERSTASSATFSQDFTSLVTNDLIQIYAKHSVGDPAWSGITDMQLYYTIQITALDTHTLVTPLATTDAYTAPTNQDP
jgi:hypothetical protein